MPGSENNVQYSGGYRLEPSSAEAIFLMQKTVNDVSRINHTGNPEGAVSANPSSLSHDIASGVVYVKNTGTGNVGWSALSTAAGTVTSVTGTTNRVTSTGGTTPVIDIASTYVGQASITTLGTIGTGTWNGTAIDFTHGGTGQTTYATGDILYASAANTLSKLPVGSNTNVLTLVAGVPAWAAPSGGGVTSLTGNSGGALSPTAGNFNILGTATNGINVSGSSSTLTASMQSPYADGDFEFRSASSGATRVLSVTNTSNTASSQAQITTSVAGTTAGDTWIQHTVGTTRTYAEGIDNSDSQKLKLTTAASATANPSTATPVWSFTPGTGFNYDVSGTSGFGIGFGLNPDTNYPLKIQKTLDGTLGVNIYNPSSGTSANAALVLSNDVPLTATVSIQSSAVSFVNLRNRLFLNAGTTGILGIVYNVDPAGSHDFYSNAAGGVYIMSASATSLLMSVPINIQTNQIFSSRGTAASAGAIGEVLSSAVTGVSITTFTSTNITSKVLTPGIWSVTGSASITTTSSGTRIQVGINAASATFTTICVDYNQLSISFTTTPQSLDAPTQIIAVSSNTTYYLNMNTTFTGTGTATGKMIAVRIA